MAPKNHMICLRLWRHLATSTVPPVVPFGFALLPCALLLGGLAVFGPTVSLARAAVTRSRTHRLSPALTPLHYTERSFATPHAIQHGGKAAAKHSGTASTARPRANGKTAGAPPAGRRGGKRTRDADYEAPIPMLRAGHGRLHGSQELASAKTHATRADGQAARAQIAVRGRRSPLATHGHVSDAVPSAAAEDRVVAEVTGSSASGDTLARLHREPVGRSGTHPPTSTYRRPVVVASAVHPGPYRAIAPSTPAPIERRAASPGLTAQPSAAYASGTADPDDLDDSEAPSGRPIQPAGPVPAVTVQAPSSAARPVPAAHPPQVVAGFGSELALAPALPSAHPGLTRRRNHPVPAPELSEDVRASTPAILAASLPSTLAERDAVTAGAMTPSVLSADLPNLYDSNGSLVMPAALRGSRENLIHQNFMADSDGLERIRNDAQLDHLRATRQLVDLPVSASLHVNDSLPYNRRCARPWTALFAQDIARDFYARFHQPLWITSAVRTMVFQSRLQRVNGNAAGLTGDFASPHLTGQAIDFGKTGMSAAQIAWMRSYLLPLMQAGRIDVEEEFQQACFHISVYRRYAGDRRVVSQTLQAASQTSSPAYAPAQTPKAGGPRSITPLTNPEMTDTE